MADRPESEFKRAEEKGKPEVGEVPFENLTTKDKIEKLIDDSLDALRLADLRSEWGRRELTRVLGIAEELGHQRGFAEGVIEEQVQNTCEDIVGNMLAKVDDGKKSGAKLVSLDETIEEQDVTVTSEAMIRARKILNDAELPAYASINMSKTKEGETSFSMSFVVDLQNDQSEPTETLAPES
jgi:hypothetical protein